jgi:ASC-1-like (ASCH) protein/ribosomal protein S18 acetylase RimI-like enzyme
MTKDSEISDQGSLLIEQTPTVEIRPAKEDDYQFVMDLMNESLGPYYGGDHIAHASRIFQTHISGGEDQLGYFSFEQKMFILTVDGKRAGMIHLVGKRQGTYKISPIALAPEFRGKRGLGRTLLDFGEHYARTREASQMYCTVAEQNIPALQFFLKNGYIVAGRSDSHYKFGIREVMLYKPFVTEEFEEKFDRPHISVIACEEYHERAVRKLLLDALPKYFREIDDSWVTALFEGYKRKDTLDVNKKYKLIFVAVDRSDTVLGVAGATPKKGGPIKIMPLVAVDLPSFVALITDIPNVLKKYGHKLYIHITPTLEQAMALQQRGWKLDGCMPGAYHDTEITYQWSLDVSGEDFMRLMRVKQDYLNMIKDGRKTLEVRAGYGNIKTIRPGERILLASRFDKQVIHVKDIRSYATIDELMKVEDAKRIIPDLPLPEVEKKLKEIYRPELERLGIFVLDIQKE